MECCHNVHFFLFIFGSLLNEQIQMSYLSKWFNNNYFLE
jgi:hypothetical protein